MAGVLEKMKVGIVGAEEKAWTDEQKNTAIHMILRLLEGDRILVSGHCPKGGIDIWAEQQASTLMVQTEIYPPKNNRWEPKGYKDRNIKIAKACDILYCFTSNGKFNGGVWTAKYAKSLGKKVVIIDIS